MEGAPPKLRRFSVSENIVSSQMRNADNQWPMRPSLFSPKRNRPRKLDSRKKERKKERKHPLHGERLPNDSAGGFGKGGPIGAKLKFHRNAGSHANREVDSEDSVYMPGFVEQGKGIGRDSVGF